MISRQTKKILGHPLASGAAILSISQYIAVAIGLVTSVIAARWLGPENYGIAAIAMSFPSLLWSFMSVKPVSVTTRYIAGFKATNQVNELLGTCKLGYSLDFFAASIVLLITILTGWWVNEYIYQIPNGYQLALIYALSFPLSAFQSTSESVLLSWSKYIWLATIPILHRASVLGLALAAFFWFGGGVREFIVATALGQAITGVFALLIATFLLRQKGFGFWWQGSIRSVRQMLKEIMSFFGWNYIVVTLSGALLQIPLLMLAKISDPTAAAYYRISINLVTVISYLETTLNKVAYPTLSARWELGQRSEIVASLRRWSWRAGLPVALLLSLFGVLVLPFLVPLLYGAEYTPVVLGTQILLLAGAFRVAIFWLDAYYFATGKIRQFAISYIIFSACVLITAWFGIQWAGFIGLCVVVAISRILFSGILALKVIK